MDITVGLVVDMHLNKRSFAALAEQVCWLYVMYGNELKQGGNKLVANADHWKHFSDTVSEVTVHKMLT